MFMSGSDRWAYESVSVAGSVFAQSWAKTSFERAPDARTKDMMKMRWSQSQLVSMDQGSYQNRGWWFLIRPEKEYLTYMTRCGAGSHV